MAEPCEYSLTTKKNNSEKIEMISQELTKPHNEVNEDKRLFLHDGYEERKCQKCGELFICARSSTALVCGNRKRDGRDDLKSEGV